MISPAARPALAAVVVILTLTGCTVSPQADDGFNRIESTIASWEGVEAVVVGGAFNGLPTSRTLSVDVTLDDTTSADLPDYLDRTLDAAWSFDVYEPSGVSVSFVDGAQSVPDGQIPLRLDLTDVAAELGLPDTAVHKNFVMVPSEQMAELYGPWPAG
ncbi:hypothetical protein N1027_14610 [Herbiconiux sp. CPCC 205763]|uniref:Uncharacterized protein n=1 Tax=Herbiconiux aconitum TaxID=2970913 RepID=A0ABT2GT11_9MICO|nr:hypothetical protein [Herbiconiux aconitum]MCS5719367.1 hypothetical protein [Herbiconiux aconitum]